MAGKYLQYCLLIVFLYAGGLSAQVTVKGRVYDITKNNPLEGVTVNTSSGKITQTDSTGYYILNLQESDTLWFSYLGKSTPKYAVSAINYKMGFDISLQIESQKLPHVTIWKPSFKMDSLANRQEYAKIFGYEKPGISTVGTGLDMEDLINVFRFRRNKRLLSLQNRLIMEEQDKYVDFRFNRGFVMDLTGLKGDSLTAFMTKYRPDYEFVTKVSMAELGIYIIECFKAQTESPDMTPAMIQHKIRIYDY
ncbi:MAG TPA: carboxypeptidase-like regulatory domain-containing protein [Parasegetibacter sp.]|jgi:hypothetical protein